MTAVEVLDRRAEAAAYYRDQRAAGTPPTQLELGQRYGMSRTWGRRVIEEVNLLDGGGHAEPDGPSLAATGAADEVPVAAPAGEWPPPVDEMAATVEPVAATPPAQAAPVAAKGWRRLGDWAAARVTVEGLTRLAVALVAAAASYGHMYHFALLAGEPEWIARAWPITVDGLALVALRKGDEARRWLGLSLLVSVGANVIAQDPVRAADMAPFVSAWPPLALYGCHRIAHPRPKRPRRRNRED